jgi:hypothetical protein
VSKKALGIEFHVGLFFSWPHVANSPSFKRIGRVRPVLGRDVRLLFHGAVN